MPDPSVAAANSAFDRATMQPKTEVAKFASTLSEKDWPLPSKEEWEEMSLDDAHALVQRIRASYEEGAGVINQRVYNTIRTENKYTCIVCGKKKSMAVDNHPNYVWRDDRQDPQTKLYTSRIICSSECYHRGSNSGSLTKAGVAANVHK